MAPSIATDLFSGITFTIVEHMTTNTQTEWQPVALVPASLSNDDTTTVEVVRTDDSICMTSLGHSGDSTDTRMTADEAEQLAAALLVAAGQLRAEAA